jgi:flagellum-specific peptidoglycan hydrolase FlgJ
MTREEFIAAALATARDTSVVSGFPPLIAVAQACLESSYGEAQLAKLAHNYFGVKAHGTQPWVAMPTCEFVGGRWRRVMARFARYQSMAESFADRDRIVGSLACYAEARGCASDPEAFARALAQHWATDPEYAEKVLEIYRELTERDRVIG